MSLPGRSKLGEFRLSELLPLGEKDVLEPESDCRRLEGRAAEDPGPGRCPCAGAPLLLHSSSLADLFTDRGLDAWVASACSRRISPRKVWISCLEFSRASFISPLSPSRDWSRSCSPRILLAPSSCPAAPIPLGFKRLW